MERIKEHRCNTISNCEVVTINKRNLDGVVRWYWMFGRKSTKSTKSIERSVDLAWEAHEIAWCPYCGENLGVRKGAL